MKPVSTFLILLLLLSCGDNNKTGNTAVREDNSKHKLPETTDSVKLEEEVYEHRSEFIYDTIRAKTAGVIDWTRPNKKAKKGQPLFSFDNYEAFNALQEKKTAFKTTIDSLITSAKGDLNYVKPKWQKFERSLRADTLLPRFPKIQYREEGEHFGNETIVNAYNEIAGLERKMSADFVKAKGDYSEISWKIKKGTRVKKGQIIAIGKRSDTMLHVIE